MKQKKKKTKELIEPKQLRITKPSTLLIIELLTKIKGIYLFSIFDFINTIKGEVFLKSFKRVLNILESENKLLLKTEVTDVNPELLQSRYEKDLFDTFKRIKLKNLDFNELLKSLVTLSQPINIFFEKVQINDKNILLKTNRLYLLFNIKNYVVREIDFSKIIKGKEL